MISRVDVSCGTFELSDEGPLEPSSLHPAGDAAVVLLHGFTGNKEIWADLREQLCLTRRVLSLDLPGHGGTRIDGVENYSMERCAAMALEAATQILGERRFSLVGYSMGARLALFAALEYPDCVRRLVLESGSAGIADGAERQERRRADNALAAFIEEAGVEAFVNRWERLGLFDSVLRLPWEVRAALRGQRLACSAAGLAASLRAMGTGAQSWLGERLDELKMPVLLLAGALDRKFVEIGQDMAARISTSRLEVIEGAGHMVHLERPAEFSRLVARFLDDE